MTTQIADKPARSRYKWTPEELEYLSNHYGLVSDKTIACNLNRSVYGVAWAAHRLGLRRKDNLYTATELARILGVAYTGRVIGWVRRGWLKCRRGPLKAGLNRAWVFNERTVAKFLRQYPWIIDLRSMPEHYFRSVVRREWERDPWYTVEQAVPLFGFTNSDAVYRYINRGWLLAERKPWGCHRAWIIRHSSIESFLKNDPRPEHKYIAASTARKRFIVLSGRPSRLAVLWVIKCPSCGQEVTVTASPKLRGPRVRETFIELYANGNCTHGADCLISTYPLVENIKRGEKAARDDDAI